MVGRSARGESEKRGHGDVSDEKDVRQHTIQQARITDESTRLYLYTYNVQTRDKYYQTRDKYYQTRINYNYDLYIYQET